MSDLEWWKRQNFGQIFEKMRILGIVDDHFTYFASRLWFGKLSRSERKKIWGAGLKFCTQLHKCSDECCRLKFPSCD